MIEAMRGLAASSGNEAAVEYFMTCQSWNTFGSMRLKASSVLRNRLPSTVGSSGRGGSSERMLYSNVSLFTVYSSARARPECRFDHDLRRHSQINAARMLLYQTRRNTTGSGARRLRRSAQRTGQVSLLNFRFGLVRRRDAGVVALGFDHHAGRLLAIIKVNQIAVFLRVRQLIAPAARCRIVRIDDALHVVFVVSASLATTGS